MTRPRTNRHLVIVATLGVTLCAMTQLPAMATPNPPVPVFPTGPGHTLTINVKTGELLSVTSTTPLEDAVVEQFDALPGSKTYTVDVSTGRYLSIIRD